MFPSLAFELTKLVHGEEEATSALNASKAIFVGGGSSENMPTTAVADSDFVDGKLTAIDMLVLTKIASSKSEARRLITQGGVSVKGEKVADVNFAVTKDDFADGEIILQKGKKVFHKLTF